VSPFARLTPEQHQFLVLFLKSRGIIKEVERAMGLSYPTVRSRLDALLGALGLVGEPQAPSAPRRKTDVLNDLEAGKITVADALGQLKALEDAASE
jgi:hypothetical protein